jgi:SAM-dependent methyltransferase
VARRRSPVRARLAPLSFLNRIAPTLPWFFAVAERDHTIQNPTSPEKLRRLGELLRLDPQSRLVDLACGRGGPAIILAETFGCRIVGVELAPEFVQVARERIAEAGLESLIDVIERDGRKFPLEPNAFDAALCLGASFIWDGLDGTLATLAPAVRASGHVVVGEPFWREWPLPDGIDPEGFTSLPGTIVRFQAADLVPVGLVAASEDDWDAYESLHWRALEDWLAEHPDDPDVDDIRKLHEEARDQYLTVRRGLLDWGIFVGRKHGDPTRD